LTEISSILITKNSQTANTQPEAASLSLGELAVNVVDGKLYVGGVSGAVVEINKTEIDGKQPLNTNLTSLAGISGSFGIVPYFTSAGNFGTISSTAFGRSVLAEANNTTLRTTLNVGNVDNTADVDKPISIATQFALDNKIGVEGATLTGFLTLHADPTDTYHAATKNYVDSSIQGLKSKQSVVVATNTAFTVVGGNSTVLVLQTPTTAFDGVTLSANNRILVKNQANTVQNGLFNYANTTYLIRSPDADTWTELVSAYVFVEQGSSAGKGFVSNTVSGGTLGTSNVGFVQFNFVPIYTANNTTGISLSSYEFSLTTTGVTPGGYNRMTVDAYGRITAANNLIFAISEGGTGAANGDLAFSNLLSAAIASSNSFTIDCGSY